jgi:hypothetical protein
MVAPASQLEYGVQSSHMFVVDIWLVIMGYLSVLDLVMLGSVSLL